jgi:carboxylesterase type B
VVAAFGGNPRLVTIDGCSAGAGSTANHMVNSRSWPYFDQAAGESGVNSQWNTNSLANAEIFFGYLSKRAGGPCGTHVASVVQCMVNLSATKLSALSLLAQIDFNSDNSTDNSTLPFAPVVDGVDVLAPPRELMQRGHIFPGPVLLGTAQDEACSLEGKSYPFDMTRSAFINDTEEEYGINGVSVKRVLELYSGHPATNSSKGFYSKYWWAAIDRGSDFSFHCPTRQAASLLSRRASLGGNRTNLASSRTNHTFLYSFKVPREQWPGLECVPHCSELGTLAMSWQQGPPNALTEAMRGYWTSFVKTGDPNIARHKGSPTWPAYTDQSQASLAFANNADQGVHIQFKYRHDECDYWDTLAGGPCNHLE